MNRKIFLCTSANGKSLTVEAERAPDLAQKLQGLFRMEPHQAQALALLAFDFEETLTLRRHCVRYKGRLIYEDAAQTRDYRAKPTAEIAGPAVIPPSASSRKSVHRRTKDTTTDPLTSVRPFDASENRGTGDHHLEDEGLFAQHAGGGLEREERNRG